MTCCLWFVGTDIWRWLFFVTGSSPESESGDINKKGNLFTCFTAVFIHICIQGMFHIDRVVIDYKTKFPTVVLVNATDVFKDVSKGSGTVDDSVFIPWFWGWKTGYLKTCISLKIKRFLIDLNYRSCKFLHDFDTNSSKYKYILIYFNLACIKIIFMLAKLLLIDLY